MLDEIKKLEKDDVNEINKIIMKCDENLIQQLLVNEDQLKIKINEARFINNSEKENNEDEQKNELLLIHEETRRMDGIINNMSESGSE